MTSVTHTASLCHYAKGNLGLEVQSVKRSSECFLRHLGTERQGQQAHIAFSKAPCPQKE